MCMAMKRKRIYIAELSWDSSDRYLFSTRKAAKTFMARYTPAPGNEWCKVSSYILNPKAINSFDLGWFSNTPEGRPRLERDEKEKTGWRAKWAKKTPLDEIMKRLNAHISVNASNAKTDGEVLRSLKKQIKELKIEK